MVRIPPSPFLFFSPEATVYAASGVFFFLITGGTNWHKTIILWSCATIFVPDTYAPTNWFNCLTSSSFLVVA